MNFAIKTVFTLGVLSVVGGCVGCTGSSENQPSVKVEQGEVVQVVALSGTVKPERETMILVPYSGYVRKLYVKVGTLVAKGDPLVAFSTSIAEEAPFPLRAAYPGVVSQVLKGEGDYVVQGGSESKVLKYEDKSGMYIESDVPESDIAKIKVDQSARIRINALQGKEFKGTILQIFQSARESENSWDRKGGTFPIRIKILDPSPDVMNGLSSVVEIRIAEKQNVLRIPQEYLKRDGAGFVVQLKKTKEFQKVEVGLKSESFVEVLKGLNLGEEILYPLAEAGSSSND
ncbi:MAG: HlyD family efflux transporter periplasmic adaptor subunit [Deltaproteobacteria bacterium]|nr:HlyD family efflux transporter periplasmic adaptor subunit [Deltaproteobacteria bacterium]